MGFVNYCTRSCDLYLTTNHYGATTMSTHGYITVYLSSVSNEWGFGERCLLRNPYRQYCPTALNRLCNWHVLSENLRGVDGVRHKSAKRIAFVSMDSSTDLTCSLLICLVFRGFFVHAMLMGICLKTSVLQVLPVHPHIAHFIQIMGPFWRKHSRDQHCPYWLIYDTA